MPMRATPLLLVVAFAVSGCAVSPTEPARTEAFWIDAEAHEINSEYGHVLRGHLRMQLEPDSIEVPGPDGRPHESRIINVTGGSSILKGVAVDKATLEPFALVSSFDIVRWEPGALRYHDLVPFVLLRFIGQELQPGVEYRTTLLGIPMAVVPQGDNVFQVFPFASGQERIKELEYRLTTRNGYAIPVEIHGGLDYFEDGRSGWNMVPGEHFGLPLNWGKGDPAADSYTPIPWMRFGRSDGVPTSETPSTIPFALDEAIQQARKDQPTVESFFQGPGPHALLFAHYRQQPLLGGTDPVKFTWRLQFGSPADDIAFEVTWTGVADGIGHAQTTLTPDARGGKIDAKRYPPRNLVFVDDAIRLCRLFFPETIDLDYRDGGFTNTMDLGNRTYVLQEVYYSCGRDGLQEFSLQLDAGTAMFATVPRGIVRADLSHPPEP